MHIIINHTSMTPIYEQIVSQIRADIINGDMAVSYTHLFMWFPHFFVFIRGHLTRDYESFYQISVSL